MENSNTLYTKEKLFNTDLKGKQREWSISVEKHDTHSVIKTVYGSSGGKMICNEKVITKGKNIGKKNETNHYTQAVSEVNSLWTKKKDTGYLEEGEEKRINFFKPMLVSDYKDNSSHIRFPCFIQPKLDGVRAIYHNGNFFSRGTKEINTVFNIQQELKLINQKGNGILNDIYLDGELFSKELLFEQIVSLVKNVKLSEANIESEIYLEYHIFDYYDPKFPDDTFEERHSKLKQILEYNKGFVYLIKTDVVNNHEEINDNYNNYLSEGYEGLIVRNSEGPYKERVKSKDVQRVKPLLSEEFKIVSFKEGEGLEKGCIIWILETEEKKTFDARPKGTREKRKKQFIDGTGERSIGKMATIKFQNYTENNKPRFPVFVCIRDYE